MRTFNKTFMWLIIVFTVIFVGLYVYLSLNGKRLLTEQLNAGFKREVTIGDVRLAFPFGVRIDDFNVQGAIFAKEARLQVGILSLFQKHFHIHSLSLFDPVITIVKTKEKGVVLGGAETGGSDAAVTPPATESGTETETPTEDAPVALPDEHAPGIMIDSLLVRNGEVRFSDHSSENKFDITIKDLDLVARDLALPMKPVDTKFDLTATLFGSPMSLSGSRMQSRGWINLFDKDMDAEVEIEDEQNQVSLTADLKANHNDLDVKGKLNIRNLGGKKKAQGEESLQDMVMGAFQSSGLAMGINFEFSTKMDNFDLGKLGFSGQVGPAPVQKNVIEDFKNIGKKFEDFGKKMMEEKPAAVEDPAVPAVPETEEVAPEPVAPAQENASPEAVQQNIETPQPAEQPAAETQTAP